MALVLKVYDRTYVTLLRTLTLTEDESCQPVLSEAGAGGFTLPFTAPNHAVTLAADQAACAYRNIVRFEDGGTPVFAMVVRAKTVVRVASGEEAEQGIDYDGPGTMGLWAKAVWYPQAPLDNLPVADTRFLTFVSDDFDDSSWSPALTADITSGQGTPPNWPDPTIDKISQVFDPDDDAPAGMNYFRRTITVPSTDMYRIVYSADDTLSLWIDGVPIVRSTPIIGKTTQTVDVMLTGGAHLFAAQVENYGSLIYNVIWFLFALYGLNQDGTLGTQVAVSDASWLALGFEDPPGFTPGHQARIFLEEAQARGALEGWSLSCTDTHDSAGIAWGAAPPSSYQIGLDGLSFLEQLGEAFADVMADPSALILDMWNFATLGDPSGVTLTPGTNVGALVNQGTG